MKILFRVRPDVVVNAVKERKVAEGHLLYDRGQPEQARKLVKRDLDGEGGECAGMTSLLKVVTTVTTC